MEAHFHLSPLIEPIGRKPFLKKWIDQKPPQQRVENKRNKYHFDDVYRFLFQLLEQENLELAYNFRYTVEAAGQAPFVKRQDQLDRALKRAKNKAYEPLERLLYKIQLELGLDYESHSPAIGVPLSLRREVLSRNEPFEQPVLPSAQEISNPEITQQEIPVYADQWNQHSALPPKNVTIEPNLKAPITPSPAEFKSVTRIQAGKDQMATLSDPLTGNQLPQRVGKNLKDLLSPERFEEPADEGSATGSPEIYRHAAQTNTSEPATDNLQASSQSLASPVSKTLHVLSRSPQSVGLKGPNLEGVKTTSPQDQSISVQTDVSGKRTRFTTVASETFSKAKPVNGESVLANRFQEASSELSLPKLGKTLNQGTIPPEKIWRETTSQNNSDLFESPSDFGEEIITHRNLSDPPVKIPRPLVTTKDEKKLSLEGFNLPTLPLKSESTPKTSSNHPQNRQISIRNHYADETQVSGNSQLTSQFFETSDSLKLYKTLQSPEPVAENIVDEDVQSVSVKVHKSLPQNSEPEPIISTKTSFLGSFKSHLKHLKDKAEIRFKESPKAASEATLTDEENYPNLPGTSTGNSVLPITASKRIPPTITEASQPALEQEPQGASRVSYSLDGFKLPSASQNDLEEQSVSTTDNIDIVNEAQDDDTTTKQTQESRGMIRNRSINQRREPISRIVQPTDQPHTDRSDQNIDGGKKSSLSKPPPLYKFQFKIKKPVFNRIAGQYDAGTSLVISRECIQRRSESVTKRDYFLTGSAAWNHFQKQELQPFYRDTTSLIVQRDCINQRIFNISLPSGHALESSSSELETFKAFDSIFNETGNKNGEGNQDPVLEFDSNHPDIDAAANSQLEEKNALELHHKQRNETYQRCLDHLNKKEAILIDYLSGKIAIDHSDKFEIEKWVRAQQSVSTEMYRLYTEAVIQTKAPEITTIQEMVRQKLPSEDLPSQRVIEIFDRLKEKSDTIKLQHKDLVHLLKRQDYLCQDSTDNRTSILFSGAYSRYRKWRNTVESPRIQVRPVNPSQHKPVIPYQSIHQKWNLPDSPKIDVRTSSDYRIKHTIPVFDKISNWRKTQSS